VGYILAGFGASLLVRNGYKTILILTICVNFISLISLILLPKYKRVMDDAKVKYAAQMKEGLSVVFRQPKVLYIVAFMSIVFGFGVIDNFFSLLFREKGLTNPEIAALIGVVYLFAGLGNILAHKLDGKKIPTVLSLVLWILLLIGAAYGCSVFAFLSICLYMMYFSGLVVLIQTYLQREIPDQMRATIFSVAGLFIEALSIIAYLTIAYGVHIKNYATGFRLLAALIGIFTVLLFIKFRKLSILKSDFEPKTKPKAKESSNYSAESA
jgi:MFS family permease